MPVILDICTVEGLPLSFPGGEFIKCAMAPVLTLTVDV